MDTPYTGGCACGAVRYEIAGVPAAELHCQCRDCQKRSGTGHSSYLVFLSRDGVATRGTVAGYEMTADSGNAKVHAFCPTCGVPVWLTAPSRPELLAVHAASLDDPERFSPGIVTYTVRAVAWDGMDPALHAFEMMPGG